MWETASDCRQSLPLRGRWHGEAVTEGVLRMKGYKIVRFTPSVTAYGGDSSLWEGAFGAKFKFVDTLKHDCQIVLFLRCWIVSQRLAFWVTTR